MATPDQYIKAISNAVRDLSKKPDEYLDLQKKRAEAEYQYTIARQAEILRLEQEGKPASTLIKKAEGAQHVAKLKFQMDVAEAMVKACEKQSDATKTAVVAYECVLAWERTTYEKANY